MRESIVKTNKFITIATAVAGLALAAGCYTERVHYRTPPPPPPPEEVTLPAPGPDYVWVHGHYIWRHHGWMWIRGGWVRRPHPRAAWVEGHWERGPNGYIWVEGFWR